MCEVSAQHTEFYVRARTRPRDGPRRLLSLLLARRGGLAY